MGAKEYKLFSTIKPNRLFDNIPESDLSFKISQKDFVSFEEGDIIFQSGDQAEIIYLIIEGRVKIKHNANVDGQRYFEKSEHEFFGEREFIQGGVRASSAVAETNVKAFILVKDVVNQLIQKNPSLLHNLQAIDPMKDVARFGMTTQFQSDEFDALMRSVRQSAGGGDPYSTTESMGIMPDMPAAASFEIPEEDEPQDQSVEISGQPEDIPPAFNPHFTMEILDPSEGSSYTVTDNTFATNDDFTLPSEEYGSNDTFSINPDLFKTGVENSFIFPGSEGEEAPEEQPVPFDFGSLNSIPDDALPLPENNIYNDIYGDQPLSTEPDGASSPDGNFAFPFDLSGLPDDDGIKKEGSLDEYLAEHPEEADMMPGSGEQSSDLNEVHQLFQQEGINLPEGFAQSLLDSDLLSKTPEELEQIIRAGAQLPPPEKQTQSDESTSEFSWDFIQPDTAAEGVSDDITQPLKAFPFDLDGFVFDEEPLVTTQSKEVSDEVTPSAPVPVETDFPQISELNEPPFHLNIPSFTEQEPLIAEEPATEEIIEDKPDFISPDSLTIEESGDIYNAEPPFHLSLPSDMRSEEPGSPLDNEDTPAQELWDSASERDDIDPAGAPFHLSLPGDNEDETNIHAATPPVIENEPPSDSIEGSDYFHSERNEDPFAPFQFNITGEQPSLDAEEIPETESLTDNSIATAESFETDSPLREDISGTEAERTEWGNWNFDENDEQENTAIKEPSEAAGDLSFDGIAESPDSFEILDPERDEAPLPHSQNEPPGTQRESLLNTLFGKSSPEKEKQSQQEFLPEDEQSGEYIWDFEKNEFVKLQPGKIEEAIPKKTSDEITKDFTKTLADEPLPPAKSTALTGEMVTSEFMWDPVTEEFVSVASQTDNQDTDAAESSQATEPDEPQGDIYNFSSPVTTGEVITSDFVWDAEKEEFISATEFDTVSTDTEAVPDAEDGETDNTSISFDSFGEPQKFEDLAGIDSAQEAALNEFAPPEENDIYTLPKDFASGDFNFSNDQVPSVDQEPQNDTTPEINFSEEALPDEPEPEGEGALWDLSDEEEPPQQSSTPTVDWSEPKPPRPIPGPAPDVKKDLPSAGLKLPTLNFLDDAPQFGDLSAPDQLPADALDQVKNWIDKASDHDLMNLLSNVGKAFETIERPPVIEDSAPESGDIYNDNDETIRENMENNSNQENKKSLRSLFKVAIGKPQPPAASEPENVFDAGDAFWGSPDDTAERESFLQEDSHDIADGSGQQGSDELGNIFTTPDTPAAFVKRNEPDFKTPLKKTAALDSMRMSSDRETGLSVEQLRMIIEAAKTVNSNVKLDEALTTIVVTASNLTKADRGTLYIIDRETDELWSKVMKGEQIEEIRLKIGQGISGWVARSGEILNLKNAYEDPRFEASFDSITGYKTTSMLCYPIKDKHDNVIAVLQLLNSQQGTFTKLDEEMISALSSFIGITIQNAELIEGMVQGDRLNSLGKVANFIISDIKKPILTIKHLAEHLRTKKDLPRDVRSVLKMILDQSIIVGDLILTTLNYSQGKVILNKKLVKINSVLDEILGMLQDAIEYKKVQIFKKYDRDVFVMVDRKELYQAFFQITKNACDAMPGGGKLQVTTKVIDEDGTIEISFKDTGMGIPEAIKEKLFEPFFSQGKKNGIGLGLPITEKIIREHGGTITVDSQLGDGANFVITIPQVTRVGG